jgi:hypothetical protein
VTALRELANQLDDHGKPSMTVDHMRLEVIALKARHTRLNNQPGENDNGHLEVANGNAGPAPAAATG